MNVKTKLKEKQPTIGSWITLAHPAIAEIMAKAGFDWLAVDLEHSVITIREAEELIRVIDLCGVVPLVRLSANDPVQIKRVMDAGSHGVIVPMVNSVAEAERAIAAVRYPPQGRRGVGLARAQGYGTSFDKYLDWVNKESVVIVQVEHIEAVNNLESIFFRRIAKKSSCKKIVITVPYLKQSRVGLHHVRFQSQEIIYAEDEHIFELNPADWTFLFLHSGWKVTFSKIYYRYPTGWPIVSIFLRWFWKISDFEGFWGAILEKETTLFDRYQDWED